MASSSDPLPRPRSRRWPVIVISILTIHAGIMFTAIIIALHKSGDSAVIPDYYNQGQAWDQHRAQLAASQKLGWNITISDDQPDATGQRQVRFTLLDAAAKPVDQADLQVHCFHQSHGDQAATLDARAIAPGEYRITLPVNLGGLWQFDFSVNRGEQRYIQSVTQKVK